MMKRVMAQSRAKKRKIPAPGRKLTAQASRDRVNLQFRKAFAKLAK